MAVVQIFPENSERRPMAHIAIFIDIEKTTRQLQARSRWESARHATSKTNNNDMIVPLIGAKHEGVYFDNLIFAQDTPARLPGSLAEM